MFILCVGEGRARRHKRLFSETATDTQGPVGCQERFSTLAAHSSEYDLHLDQSQAP